ncbi:MAG: S-methyl-5'-thioinosine phosphorylase [Thiohalocapsa sp.]|jgi:5'-deoxy-5'-methylthioadenosine phosphorylase|uniref:S-methyl-5'-thioinosine phosphorylase n=1 Tax=Thiohalocapsa sp. TaxID=2497641 RepID=UPI0025D6498B|nr:S-methyl-5'-thioinosine phosphorylase [Thiohalocapsa sp.]MCG6940059.1 S-methyl-5'-thioinosine phosphorylase [Thiohalocapsa sp.]
MGLLGIIGGSGFTALPETEIVDRQRVETPYGAPSAELLTLRHDGQEFRFLPRHGADHGIPPHAINYRANIQALCDSGVTQIVALGAVGGIADDCGPLRLCVPDQLIDYTWGRPSTYFDGAGGDVVHVDFSAPFAQVLRERLLASAQGLGLDPRDGGTYAVTQGPRLETAGEIRRLERDGCDLVGMTAMPEAVLARERALDYALLAFVVNWAAGKREGEVGMGEIRANLVRCQDSVRRLLLAFVAAA